MRITVSDDLLDHFFKEPQEGDSEFWAFIWPVRAKVGDPIYFYNNKKLIASAVVNRVEKPGESSCLSTGQFKNKWKVHWLNSSFKDERKRLSFSDLQKRYK
jgi:hypothetical protein